MRTKLAFEVDELLSQLDALERQRVKFDRLAWVALPAIFGGCVYCAAEAVLEISWLSACWHIALSVINWDSAQRHIKMQQLWRTSVEQQRRRLKWFRGVAAGEDYRRAHCEEGRKMEEEKGNGVFVDVRSYCERHGERVHKCGANPAVAHSKLAMAFMAKFTAENAPKDPTDFEQHMRAFAATDMPMCCYLGDEAVEKINEESKP